MAKTLNILTNGGKLNSVASAGLKLSKNILVEKIEEHKRFKDLYSIDTNLLQRIVDNIQIEGFDPSQPVHIWLVADENETEHYYLIDGYTRFEAAKQLGLVSIPYYEHKFKTFDEAYRYVLHLQVDRRNLEGADLLNNIRELMGTDYIQNLKGNKNDAIGEMLGVSGKTIERANFVDEAATEEQLAEIEAGTVSVNQVYTDIKHQKYVEKNATAEQQERIDSGESTVEEIYDELKSAEKAAKQQKKQSSKKSDSFDNDISDALDDTAGNPAPAGFHQQEEINSPVFIDPEEDETDRWIREKNLQVETARKEGFADGFYKALCFALGEVKKGRLPEDIYNDERLSDLSPTIICDFQLPEDCEDIVTRF